MHARVSLALLSLWKNGDYSYSTLPSDGTFKNESAYLLFVCLLFFTSRVIALEDSRHFAKTAPVSPRERTLEERA